jgi:hypothetical protein
MYQLGFNPFIHLEYERRLKELMRMADQNRLLAEVRKAGAPNVRSTSKILARVGKELIRMGASLEERYGNQTETNLALNQQSDPSGCS